MQVLYAHFKLRRRPIALSDYRDLYNITTVWGIYISVYFQIIFFSFIF